MVVFDVEGKGRGEEKKRGERREDKNERGGKREEGKEGEGRERTRGAAAWKARGRVRNRGSRNWLLVEVRVPSVYPLTSRRREQAIFLVSRSPVPGRNPAVTSVPTGLRRETAFGQVILRALTGLPPR